MKVLGSSMVHLLAGATVSQVQQPTRLLCQEDQANAQEQLTMLHNGTVISEVRRFLDVSSSDKSQDKLKSRRMASRGQLAKKGHKGHKAADTLMCLTNALEAGHGHGLEVYTPAM